MIAPIKVCELEAGMPMNQVAKFQIMAPKSNDKTMAIAGTRVDTDEQIHRQ